MNNKTFSQAFILGFEDADGALTPLGKLARHLNKFRPEHARMLLEADALGVVGDVLSVIALSLASCDVTRGSTDVWQQYTEYAPVSDILGQLDIFNRADELRSKEIVHPGSYAFAQQQRRMLTGWARECVDSLDSSHDPDNILRAVCAGMMPHLYRWDRSGAMEMCTGKISDRQVSRWSTVSLKDGGYFFAWPWEYKEGKKLLRLLTPMSLDKIADIAPHCFFSTEGIEPQYNFQTKKAISTTHVFFLNTKVAEMDDDAPDTEETRRVVEHGRALDAAKDAREKLRAFKSTRKGWSDGGLANLSIRIEERLKLKLPKKLEDLKADTRASEELLTEVTTAFEAAREAVKTEAEARRNTVPVQHLKKALSKQKPLLAASR